jgi:hypothetical protein
MEYASYLAGMRWSDRPSCTDPTLAALARLVNDLSSDGSRSRLVPHIPSVVGLVGHNPLVPIYISVLAASTAIPIANESRQRALATALVRCEQLLKRFHNVDADRARERITTAFSLAPGSEEWARAFMADAGPRVPHPIAPTDEAILRASVLGIADACVPDSDARLERLLASAIEETRLALGTPVEREVVMLLREDVFA